MDESAVAAALVATLRTALANSGQLLGSDGAAWTTDTARGWPQEQELRQANAPTRMAVVRVYPRPGMSRDTTRFPTTWSSAAQPCALTVSVTGQTATFAGTCAVGQGAAVLVGRTVYPYRVQASDTPTSVASVLATMCGGVSSGPTVSVQGLTQAQTGMDSVASREVRRQEQSYMVTVWCADPIARDAVTGAADAALAGLADANGNIRPFITASDGEIIGPVRYEGTTSFDKAKNADVYRRDLFYRVEYPTIQTMTQPVMLFGGLTMYSGDQFILTGADGDALQGTDGAVLINTDQGTHVVQGLVTEAEGDDGSVLTGADGAILLTTADGGNDA